MGGYCYKLTTQDNRTYGDTLWVPGQTKRTSGEGELCGPGWLHWYDDPMVGLMLNPEHADIKNPKVWLAEWGGVRKDDRGLKSGSTELTILEPVEIVPPTTAQRVAFGILCAAEVYADAPWVEWAEGWLAGADRSPAAACAAYDAAYAAYATFAAADAAYYAAYAAAACAAAAAPACADAAADAAGPLDLPALAAWALTLGSDD